MSSEEIVWRGIIIGVILTWWLYRMVVRIRPFQRQRIVSLVDKPEYMSLADKPEYMSLAELWNAFMANVTIDAVGSFTSGCWEWDGQTSGDYGCFSINGHQYLVHRLLVGAARLHRDMHVHHTCHNKLCVSPPHLQILDSSAHASLHHSGKHNFKPVTPVWEGIYIP